MSAQINQFKDLGLKWNKLYASDTPHGNASITVRLCLAVVSLWSLSKVMIGMVFPIKKPLLEWLGLINEDGRAIADARA